jgi:hypothetical protein
MWVIIDRLPLQLPFPAQFDPRARPFLYFDKLLQDDNEPMSSTFALTKV